MLTGGVVEARAATTVPAAPSTVTTVPSRSRQVAPVTPRTAGMCSSRATIAACESTPPVSVTTPAATRRRGVHAGSVLGQIRMSPGSTRTAATSRPSCASRATLASSSRRAAVGSALAPVADQLSSVLPRLGGYDARFDTALRRARGGDPRWVDRTDVDSCHRVWFELHEDLVATLGIDRRAEQSTGA